MPTKQLNALMLIFFASNTVYTSDHAARDAANRQKLTVRTQASMAIEPAANKMKFVARQNLIAQNSMAGYANSEHMNFSLEQKIISRQGEHPNRMYDGVWEVTEGEYFLTGNRVVMVSAPTVSPIVVKYAAPDFFAPVSCKIKYEITTGEWGM